MIAVISAQNAETIGKIDVISVKFSFKNQRRPCEFYELCLVHWEKKWSQNGSTLENVLENGATSEGGAVFSLINMFNQGGAVSDLFLDKNSSTIEGGTKIVPGVELSYVPWNGSRGRAILSPLFFSVWKRGVGGP